MPRKRQANQDSARAENVRSVLVGRGHGGVERRSGEDRRKADQPHAAPERRTGGDRRGQLRRALKTVAASVGDIAEGATSVAGKAAGAASTVAERASDAAVTVAEKAVDAGSAVVDRAGDAAASVAELAGTAATPIASAAERRRAEAARLRALRAAASRPLPSLWEAHPDARRAALRDLGLQTVPIDRIRGTAVAGSAQRGGDFLPLRHLRGTNWEGRWQRIRRAVDRLENLPPVDLLKYGDDYWVVDGHNRVAAANYAGQVATDASVVELRAPGMARTEPPRNVGQYLAAERNFTGFPRSPTRKASTADTADSHTETLQEAGATEPGE